MPPIFIESTSVPGIVSHLNSFLYLFIIFKFLAVPGLHCCTGFLQLWRLGPTLAAFRGLLAVVAPLVVEQASAAVVGVLSSCGHGLSCSAAVDLPGPAFGPCPALPGEFLTTRPPGKSPHFSS